MLPRVSIIIPAFNAGKTIKETICGCLHQDYPKEALEIIVVDDGSTDTTQELIKEFPSVKYIYQNRSGAASARNRGAKASRSEFLFFIDADCIPQGDWVKKILTHFHSNEGIGCVGGSYGIKNPKVLLAKLVYEEILYRHRKMPRFVRAIGSYNFAIRKKTFDELGGFDESFRMASGEDNEICFRIVKRGHKILFDPQILVYHYHPSSLLKYLRAQFWHGFWRVLLYKKHPARISGDDYSDFFDYLQPLIGLFVLLVLSLSAIIKNMAQIFYLLLIFYILLAIFLAARIFLKNGNRKLFSLVPLFFLRGFARGLGLMMGVIRFFVLIKRDG